MSLFDSRFVYECIQRCIAICETQQKHGFDNPEHFKKSLNQANWFIDEFGELFLPVYVKGVKSHLFDLMQCYLTQQSLFDLEEDLFFEELQAHNEKNQQVPKPAPSAQLSVFRVLGQVTKTQVTLGTAPLSIDWRPTDPMPSKLFSITRPVGGLEQCQ